jgi:dynein heavy chain 1, cytosolic
MSLLSSLRNLSHVDVIPINFSSETSYDFVIKTLEIHCNYKKSLGGETLSPKIDGRWVVLFCDEINLSKPDYYGTQRVISFLRQIIEQKGFWRSDRVWVGVQNVQIVGACNPPTDAGRIVLSERFLRHSPVVYVDYPGEESLGTIYGTLSRACLQAHPSLRTFADPLTNAMVGLYISVKLELTADKWSHYIFSPRELTRWIRGIHDYLSQSEFASVEDLVRIWAHEAIRLFRDRVADEADRIFLDTTINDTAIKHFPGIDVDIALQSPILFSTFLSKSYQSSDRSQLMEFVEEKLQVYYEEELDTPLVLFDSGLDHILRIDRVFRQVQGHLLLIGLSGSGKSTLTRFACWMNGITFYQPSMHSNYSIADFEEDLRIVLKRAGCKGESICFMMDEANIMESSFLERMNTLLANAEIPGLFEGDDFTTLMAACKEGSAREGLNLESHDQLYRWFSKQIAKNLHVVFSMNPPSGNMSAKASSSPALFNRCVLNWMGDWDEQAFFQVGKEFTGGIDFTQPFKCSASFIPSISLLNPPLSYLDAVLDTLIFCHFTCRQMLKTANSSQAFVHPKQYVDFCHLFTSIYLEKRAELEDRQRHIIVGLERLKATVDKVTELRSSLSFKKAELEKKSEEANEKLKKMVSDQQFAENKRSISLSIKQSLTEKNAQIAERRQIVKEDLELAEPAVAVAQESVSSIKKQHLTELRSMGNPPNAIKLAMESVCILLGHKVESWKSVQAVLRRDDFISSIVNYDTTKLTSALRREVNDTYILDPAYNFDNANRASKACGPLVNWVIAQVGYADILEKVGPLREELVALEDSANSTELEAENNQNLVAKLESSIAIYKEEYAVLISEAQALKAEMATVKGRVERSVNVLENLSSERERWSKSRESFGSLTKTVVGDSLLASSFVSYAGIFDQSNRNLLLKTMKGRLAEAGIPFQANLSLPDYLTSEAERSEWYRHNLPSDSLCVENALMLQRTSRYPLIIDPSGQAVNFLKSFYKSKSLAITSFRDTSFLKVLESALRFGNPILIEDSENFDSIINGVLNREIRRSGSRSLCRLGKKDVDISPNFKLFLSTKNEGHNFSPDISCRVSFINFTVTSGSLQSQCLNKFLLNERPDIEIKRRDLLRMQGEFQLRLHTLEKSLLDALNKSTGSILEDEEVLRTLEILKREANDISLKAAETDNVLVEVESVTSLYEPLAELCSSIYFCVESFSCLRNTYQFSLQQFFAVFDQILKSSSTSIDRVTSLRAATLCHYFKAVSQSLWYEDTHLLALMLAQISEDAFDKGWSLFLDPLHNKVEDSNEVVSDLGVEASSRVKFFVSLPSFRLLLEKLKSSSEVILSNIFSSINPEIEIDIILSKLGGKSVH